MSWIKSILKPNESIKNSIQNLNDTGLQITLVVDDFYKFLGTVTDGDIRRALLRGLDLSSPISLIMNRKSLVVPPSMSRDVVLQLMKANRIHQIPIVDEKGILVGLHLMDEILHPNRLDNSFVIMAGGKGVRLRPHTENCPKPMLIVAGKPMLEHIIEKATSEGFHDFQISIHYLGHIIEDYFGDGSDRGISINYLREDSPLGTAGALGNIIVKPTQSFIVTNGDVLTDIRYSELLQFHNSHRASATMSVKLHEWQHPYGVVKTNGVDILGFEEKPIHRTHINAGIYALEPEVLNYINHGERCDMPTLFERIASKGNKTIVYPMHEPWMDVGRPDDLESAQNSMEI